MIDQYGDSVREMVGAKAAMGYIRGAGLVADDVLDPIDKALNRLLEVVIVSQQIALVTVRGLADENALGGAVESPEGSPEGMDSRLRGNDSGRQEVNGADPVLKHCPDCNELKPEADFLQPSGRPMKRCLACQRLIWNRQAAEKKAKKKSGMTAESFVEIIENDTALGLERAKEQIATLAAGRHAFKDSFGAIWFIAEVDKTLPVIRWTAWKRDPKDGLSCVKTVIPDGSYPTYFAALDALDAFANVQKGWEMVEAPSE